MSSERTTAAFWWSNYSICFILQRLHKQGGHPREGQHDISIMTQCFGIPQHWSPNPGSPHLYTHWPATPFKASTVMLAEAISSPWISQVTNCKTTDLSGPGSTAAREKVDIVQKLCSSVLTLCKMPLVSNPSQLIIVKSIPLRDCSSRTYGYYLQIANAHL